MRLSGYTERTNTAHIEIMDEAEKEKIDELDVVYSPATWTPEFESRIRSNNNETWTSAVLAETLSEAVVSWTLTEDVTDADGNVIQTVEVPHTKERLVKVPTNLLLQIVSGISGDMRPKAKPKPSSENGT